MTDLTTITLDGPGMNALGTTLMQRLLADLEAANGAPVLLTGNGRALSAGLHLREVVSCDGPEMRAFLSLLETLMATLYTYPGATAVAVNGHAIAGGCILTLCCDHRVMTDDPTAKIGLNEVALGLRFPPRILEIVRRRIPRRHLLTVGLGAGLFGADQALDLGLVDRVGGDSLGAARQWLRRVGSYDRSAYAATKRALRGHLDYDAVAFDNFLEDGLDVWTSDALKARIGHLLNKS